MSTLHLLFSAKLTSSILRRDRQLPRRPCLPSAPQLPRARRRVKGGPRLLRVRRVSSVLRLHAFRHVPGIEGYLTLQSGRTLACTLGNGSIEIEFVFLIACHGWMDARMISDIECSFKLAERDYVERTYGTRFFAFLSFPLSLAHECPNASLYNAHNSHPNTSWECAQHKAMFESLATSAHTGAPPPQQGQACAVNSAFINHKISCRCRVRPVVEACEFHHRFGTLPRQPGLVVGIIVAWRKVSLVLGPHHSIHTVAFTFFSSQAAAQRRSPWLPIGRTLPTPLQQVQQVKIPRKRKAAGGDRRVSVAELAYEQADLRLTSHSDAYRDISCQIHLSSSSDCEHGTLFLFPALSFRRC